eukprot:COSAG02_NODE_4146_length_5717_cov_3.929690_8_plen_45_part_00
MDRIPAVLVGRILDNAPENNFQGDRTDLCKIYQKHGKAKGWELN